MNRAMNSLNSKILIYILIGYFVGLLIRMNILSNQHHSLCKRSIKASSVAPDVVESLSKLKEKPITVKAKSTKFNNNYRPYFVFSELGFKEHIIIGVKTTESQLINYGVSINNTWSVGNLNIIFFTPYSRNLEFHDRYVKKLNLNIVQLPDIIENSSEAEFSLRILQYMKDHFLNKFNWFVLTNSNVYVNIENLQNYLKLLNSTSEIIITGKNNKICDTKGGLILSHNALSKYSSNHENLHPTYSLLSTIENQFKLFCVSVSKYFFKTIIIFNFIIHTKYFINHFKSKLYHPFSFINPTRL